MPSAFAIRTLHVCRKAGVVNPDKTVSAAEVEIVPAGQIADLTDDDFKSFEKAGAARRPSKMDRAMAEGDDEPEAIETAAGKATASAPVRVGR